jgi:hypothetical protein
MPQFRARAIQQVVEKPSNRGIAGSFSASHFSPRAFHFRLRCQQPA